MFATLWKFGLQVLPWTNHFTTTAPTTCFDSASTLVELVHCFDTYTVPREFYTRETYDNAQPTITQRADWRILVDDLLSVDSEICDTVDIPSSLDGIYAVRPFQRYCVLYETTSSGGIYDKGWGFVVVPSLRSAIARHVHVSAPHPKFDSGTVEQAAAIFDLTGSSSLLVTGRHRDAFLHESSCVPPYSITDPAHNTAEPFYDAIVVIRDWQHALGGCPSASCAFIQMHGKAATTCKYDTVFLSSGLGDSASSTVWYQNGVDRPVKRLKANLKTAFSAWNVTLPPDTDCNLTATKNVGGRYINSIPSADVCSVGATASIATGEFIHIEQASIARDASNYVLWSQAVSNSF